MSTKELILNKSLQLFSERGYEGVSMRDIAAEVGIKAASIYNHFSSKEEIFNHLLEEMDLRYNQAVSAIGVPEGSAKEAANSYVGISEEHLHEIAKGLFLYFLKDEFAAPFRRMVTAEQYRHSIAGDTFQKMYVSSALEFQSSLFETLITQGVFTDSNPQTVALHFYAPIFLLLSKYDKKPESESEALNELKNHVSQFSRLYSRR
ncbi:TetR/AcrR family transcriptional regulator [Lachnoclostridium phytofermentans]|uniref:Transcriptional regulator, TetR family n=1 Tax=Lachnoclostridium phytofermentans (strain ATCC 700394 / DSM 18823 / ISDg) TaxID=357809 RepID=A9KT22_LACP7|nr:TetR/AcrR family transcriptional regulator [Lachnoclostridium phytofermentans]ABX42233.1 transcriptional regulator, TetR family [Lachnoclostridium phytofermentans ISDg]